MLWQAARLATENEQPVTGRRATGNGERATKAMHHYDIAYIGLDEGQPLRAALLPDAVDLPGADHSSAGHVGGFRDGVLVGVASVHPEPKPGGPSLGAWRISAVAVEHGHRGKGLGLLLVERCLDHAETSDGKVVWVEAPQKARGFFERLGFSGVAGGADGDAEHRLHREIGRPDRSWAVS